MTGPTRGARSGRRRPRAAAAPRRGPPCPRHPRRAGRPPRPHWWPRPGCAVRAPEQDAAGREQDDQHDERQLRAAAGPAGGGPCPGSRSTDRRACRWPCPSSPGATRPATGTTAGSAGPAGPHAAISVSSSWDDDDLAIGLVGRQQLGMGADADDPAGLEDHDAVGGHDGAHPLGDDDDGRVARAPGRGPPGGARRCPCRAPRSCRRTRTRPGGGRWPARWRGAVAGRPRRWCRPG